MNGPGEKSAVVLSLSIRQNIDVITDGNQNIVFLFVEKRTPRAPQAYFLKNVFAAGARDTFHAFQGWAGPSRRATGHSLQHRSFKSMTQELHFKDFGKSIKRENKVGNKLSEMSSFP